MGREQNVLFPMSGDSKGVQDVPFKVFAAKKAETSRWQDLLLGVVRGVATIADSLRKAGIETNQEVGDYLVDALFATITNANFDDQAILNKGGLWCSN